MGLLQLGLRCVVWFVAGLAGRYIPRLIDWFSRSASANSPKAHIRIKSL